MLIVIIVVFDSIGSIQNANHKNGRDRDTFIVLTRREVGVFSALISYPYKIVKPIKGSKQFVEQVSLYIVLCIAHH